MGIRGQRPTPTALRLVKGGKRSAKMPPPMLEPSGKPECPVQLTAEQQAAWRQFVTPAGWLTAADTPLCVVFVCLYAEFLADPAGTQAARIANLRAAMASLGFDASQRARMGAMSAAPAPDPLVAEYFS